MFSRLLSQYPKIFGYIHSSSMQKTITKSHLNSHMLGSALRYLVFIYFSQAFQDSKMLAHRRGGLPQPGTLKQGYITISLILVLFQELFLRKQLNWNDRYFTIFQVKERDFLQTFFGIMGHSPGCSCLCYVMFM